MKNKLTDKEWIEKATKYVIQEFSPQTREVSIEKRGDNAWSVSCDGSVLHKSKGCFEREPMPSSRTDKFIKNTRFETKEEAYTAWCNYLGNSPF